jgi:hypothetical protein
VFRLDRIDYHEKECLHRPHRCPFAVAQFKCNWRGHLFSIRNHVLIRHTLSNSEVTRQFEATLEKFGTNTAWYETFILQRQVFFLCSRLTSNCFYSCLLFVGPQGRERNYNYTITIKTKDSTRSVSASHGTLSYLNDTDEIYRTGNCFAVGTGFVKKCLGMKGELQLQIEICRNTN